MNFTYIYQTVRRIKNQFEKNDRNFLVDKAKGTQSTNLDTSLLEDNLFGVIMAHKLTYVIK